MAKDNALKLLKKNIDFSRIIEVFNAGRFWEFVVSCYGDIKTFRVYENGSITER